LFSLLPPPPPPPELDERRGGARERRGEMKVSVKTLKGSSFQIEVNPADKVPPAAPDLYVCLREGRRIRARFRAVDCSVARGAGLPLVRSDW
jgi:hypothetical protein